MFTKANYSKNLQTENQSLSCQHWSLQVTWWISNVVFHLLPSWHWSPVWTLPVDPLWCDLGFVPNSSGNKAAANLRPGSKLLLQSIPGPRLWLVWHQLSGLRNSHGPCTKCKSLQNADSHCPYTVLFAETAVSWSTCVSQCTLLMPVNSIFTLICVCVYMFTQLCSQAQPIP